MQVETIVVEEEKAVEVAKPSGDGAKSDEDSSSGMSSSSDSEAEAEKPAPQKSGNVAVDKKKVLLDKLRKMEMLLK